MRWTRISMLPLVAALLVSIACSDRGPESTSPTGPDSANADKKNVIQAIDPTFLAELRDAFTQVEWASYPLAQNLVGDTFTIHPDIWPTGMNINVTIPGAAGLLEQLERAYVMVPTGTYSIPGNCSIMKLSGIEDSYDIMVKTWPDPQYDTSIYAARPYWTYEVDPVLANQVSWANHTYAPALPWYIGFVEIGTGTGNRLVPRDRWLTLDPDDLGPEP